MSEVTRYWLPSGTLTQQHLYGLDDTCVVQAWAYDQLKADNDALRAELAALKAGQGVAVAPYGYLREVDGNAQLSIGALRPADRSGGIATPWAAIFAAPPASADAVSVPVELLERIAREADRYDDSPMATINDNCELWQIGHVRLKMTVGDLRELRALLAQSESEG